MDPALLLLFQSIAIKLAARRGLTGSSTFNWGHVLLGRVTGLLVSWHPGTFVKLALEMYSSEIISQLIDFKLDKLFTALFYLRSFFYLLTVSISLLS